MDDLRLDDLPTAQREGEVTVELALLGCVFHHPEAFGVLVDAVEADDFPTDAHRLIWRTMGELWRDGKTPGLLGVGTRLHDGGDLPRIGGMAGLGAIREKAMEYAPTPVAAPDYAERLRDLSTRRRLAALAGEIVAETRSPTMPGREALDWAAGRLLGLVRRTHAGNAVELAEAIAQAFERIDARTLDPNSQRGTPVGLAALEALLPGLQGGELVILGARPSVGKTALSLAMATEAARATSLPVLFVSLEQAAVELAERYLASAAGVPLQALRSGWLDDKARARLADARENSTGNGSLWIDDRAGQGLLRVAAQARRLQARAGLALVVIDYLQLLQADDRRIPRHEQVAALSRGLKLLARDLSVPILVLAQLNRELESRGSGGKPRMSDLRESGAIEADADTVLLLHRPDQPPGNVQTVEVIVAKQRNGPTGEVSMRFVRDLMRFESMPQTPFN